MGPPITSANEMVQVDTNLSVGLEVFRETGFLQDHNGSSPFIFKHDGELF